MIVINTRNSIKSNISTDLLCHVIGVVEDMAPSRDLQDDKVVVILGRHQRINNITRSSATITATADTTR